MRLQRLVSLVTIFLVMLSVTGAFAQGTVMPVPQIQFLDSSGDPLNGGLLNAYQAGTTTRQDTYTTSALSVANANPVVLDSAGRATVFLSANNYRFILTDSASTTIWDIDNVRALVPSGSSVDTTGTPANNQIAVWTDADTLEGDANLTWDGTTLIVNSTGPHVIGASATVNYMQHYLAGGFTSGGGSDVAAKVFSDGLLTGANGDTTYLAGQSWQNTITTQGNTETIPIVAQARFEEPGITIGSGDTVTVAATVYIEDGPTEGTNDYGLFGDSGALRWDGQAVFGGDDTDATYQFEVSGAFTTDAADGAKVLVEGTLTSASGAAASYVRIDPSMTQVGGDQNFYGIDLATPTLTVIGDHGIVSGVRFAPFVITGGGSATSTRLADFDMVADDTMALAIQSSDITTGLASVTAEQTTTNDILSVSKASDTLGGTILQVMGEDDALGTVLDLRTYGGTATTTKTTAGRALIEAYASEHNGSNALSDIAADGNVWAVRARRAGADVTLSLLDEDGDLWIGGPGLTTGGTLADYLRVRLGGDFTSGGGSTIASAVYADGALTGANGDTSYLSGQIWVNTVTTQGNTETITTVSQARFHEPNITVGSGDTVTNSATIYVVDAATEATNDYGVWVDDGIVRIDDRLRLTPQASAPASPASGDMYMDSTPSPDELCVYDGTGWQALITGTDANCA